MTTVTTVSLVATLSPKPVRIPYPIFAIGLEQLYSMPLEDGEDVHIRCMAIDRYIDSNGWTWDDLLDAEEIGKPKVDFNRN